MADIRINSLSTTASSTASDDFVPIDGTTNGTRKLSAYSPSFGGNATVGGTLTVSGATMSIGGGSGSIVSALDGTAGNYKLHLFRSGGVDRWYCGVQSASETGSNAGAPFAITALSDAGAQIDIPVQITRAAGGSIFLGRPVKAQDTTASTNSSSGALVVGNGTSGGLGVGGAINAGGILKTTVADAAYNARFFGATGGMRVRGYTDATYGTVVDSLNTAESAYQPLTIASSTLRLNDLTNGAIVTGTGTFTISGTTASNNTSSGALVVGNGTSGGLGVGGAIFAGGNLTVSGTGSINGGSGTAALAIKETASAATALLLTNRNSTQTWGIAVDAAAVDDKQLAFISGGNVVLSLNATTLAATLAGNLTTGAPSGGTAAAWKLGTVATVSPTSPNRTIEVDIGGTIYYIHAKTTNN
jgi:hypothetical protein